MTRWPRLKAPSPERSAIMRAVRGQNTGPERAVRRLLAPLARGYRLQARELPGSPDIVFRPRKLAIFVHGCFWHGHACPRGSRTPKTNAAYWRAKIARNRARDVETLAALKSLGWRSVTVFECELADEGKVTRRLARAVAKASPALSAPPPRRPP